MTILTSEFKAYRSASPVDGSTGGGRMSAVPMSSSAIGGLFPNVTGSERASGITRLRKAFLKVANPDGLRLSVPYVYIRGNTPGDDKVVFFPGTQRDTASAVTGSERKYGAARSVASIDTNDVYISVTPEDISTLMYYDGDIVCVSNRASSAEGGIDAFLTISGTPVISGATVIIHLNSTVGFDFPDGALVSSVYQGADVFAVADTYSKTSTAGGFVSGVTTDNIGTIEQTWTGVFTSATDYGITGDIIGSVGSGSRSAQFSPSNPDFTRPYFRLPQAAMTGTWVAGDSFTFQTHPAAVPVWFRQVVPAGSNPYASNEFKVCMQGESE